MADQLYDPSTIEPKWQAFWKQRKVFRTPNPGDPDFDPAKPKYYVLDMFPYPSGSGLHVGHPEGYTATDIVARHHRMRGCNVLHPMGWDAFGLPAEQYAIQMGKHPAATTRENTANFRRQLEALGFSYDWDREIDTSSPDYYRWTQWIFARLHEKGLAYATEAPVWWCEALGTVLANDEVVNGRSERGDHPCERRPLRQWMLRITSYAERLLQDLEELDWSESLKQMQREWIGKSEGAEIEFALAGHADTVRVFTTRPDTIFGVGFMVLAPEHPLVAKITTPAQRAAVQAYQLQAAGKSELDRTELSKEMSGVFTGAFAHNPLLPAQQVPVWIADYVLVSYGTGAIMGVPAGDERDFRFAQRFGLPIPPIFATAPAGEACVTEAAPYINSRNSDLDLGPLALEAAKRAVIGWLEARGLGRSKTTYRMRDWLFSRQRYWGEPFPIVHRADGTTELVPDDALPVLLPEMADFKPSGRPEPTLEKAAQWVATKDRAGRPARRETNTMPGSAGSSWYFLRFCDPHNTKAPCSAEAARYWLPVDLYIGGTEHAVGHLLYARFWHKVLHDLGLVPVKEPFAKLYNQGMILSFAFEDARGGIVPVTEAEDDGKGGFRRKATGEALHRIVTKMSKRYHNVVNPDDVVREYGADTLRLYEMFMGPLADTKPWDADAVPGVHRFLARVWRLVVPEDDAAGRVHAHLQVEAAADPAVEKVLHRTIAKVTGDIARLAFNTAISAMMIFVNEATKARVTRGQMLRFVQILAPFAPHLAEELWARLGQQQLLAYAAWPAWDPHQLEDATVELAVQINGKVRGRVTVATGAADAEVLAAAKAQAGEHLAGKTLVKEVVVKGRLVNFVVR